MKISRPFRAHEVYAALCLGCDEEIESPVLPVPEYCPTCKAKREKAAKS